MYNPQYTARFAVIMEAYLKACGESMLVCYCHRSVWVEMYCKYTSLCSELDNFYNWFRPSSWIRWRCKQHWRTLESRYRTLFCCSNLLFAWITGCLFVAHAQTYDVMSWPYAACSLVPFWYGIHVSSLLAVAEGKLWWWPSQDAGDASSKAGVWKCVKVCFHCSVQPQVRTIWLLTGIVVC